MLWRIAKYVEETLEKHNIIKLKLLEKYGSHLQLVKGQKLSLKRRKILSVLATEEWGDLRNIDKFIQNTLFLNRKKIMATLEGLDQEKTAKNEYSNETITYKEVPMGKGATDKKLRDKNIILIWRNPQ